MDCRLLRYAAESLFISPPACSIVVTASPVMLYH